MKKIIKFLVCIVLLFPIVGDTDDRPTIRIGSLQYGSVNWELKLIQDLGLDIDNDYKLEIVELASKNAAAVALQGKAVDLIVTDWFWVSRQRSEGRMFTFFPHSMAAGGLIVSKDSLIKKDIDLKGKKIGVAGGQVDKGWLIYRAYFKKKYGEDLLKMSKPIFGAPPLLNKKIKQKSFDAILTYWPYQAQLIGDSDFEKIINITDVISELGVPKGVPVIGWVFKESWGNQNKNVLNNFLNSSKQAKQLMLEDDKVWEQIRPNMNVADDTVYQNLIKVYREGIPKSDFSSNQLEGSRKLYSILAEIGGKDLVGKAKQLSSGTFWID